MKLRTLMFILIVGVLSLLLAACGLGAAGGATAGGDAQSGTARPAGAGRNGTGQNAGAGAGPRAGGPSVATPTPEPTIQIARGISAIGEVKALQDTSLTFAVQGTVAQVLVKAGDVVTKGQTLAILDTRSFDQKVEQAQAALDIAQAAQDALTDPPKSADVAAAQAQVRLAQIALAQARVNQPQNLGSAQANVSMAQANLQTQRDKLSQTKTDAEQQVQQSALALTQAQAAYAKAKSDWDYVQSTGRNPAQPSVTNSQGKSSPNKINDSQSAGYYQTFVQAEAALHKAELAVQQSEIDADAARQGEVNGIQSAEQQVTQAQTGVDKLNLPNGADTVAQAQASLDAARANLAKLSPAPGRSDQEKAAAVIRQAQAALDAAKLDRANAELRAPFDGVVAAININPGDPSSVAGQVPARVIDISKLHVDVNVNDIDIGHVSVGQAVQVFSDASPSQAHAGKVSTVAPAATVSGNLRTYLVSVALDNQDGLLPGMSVRVTFATPQ